MEIGLDPFSSESMWEQNQCYLTAINVLVGVRQGDEDTTMTPALSSKTYV